MNLRVVLTLSVIALLIASPADAYVDPGTGGMLIQLVTGGVAGLLVLGRLYWRRLKGAVTGKPDPAAGPDPSIAEPPDSSDLK